MGEPHRSHDPDERVSIPLDPETALRGLLKVDPDVPPYPLNGEEFAAKHRVEGLPLRNMLRRHPDLVDGHEKWEHTASTVMPKLASLRTPSSKRSHEHIASDSVSRPNARICLRSPE